MSEGDKKDEVFFEAQEYEGTGRNRVNKNYCLKHALNNLFGTDWVTTEELTSHSKHLSEKYPNRIAKTSNWGSDDAIFYVNRAKMFDDENGTFLYRLMQIPPNVWEIKTDNARRSFFVAMFKELYTDYRGSTQGLGYNWFVGFLKNVNLNHWVCYKVAHATYNWKTYFYKDSMEEGIIPYSQKNLIDDFVNVAKRNHQICIANKKLHESQRSAYENICLLFCKTGLDPNIQIPKLVRQNFPFKTFKNIKSNSSTGSSSSSSSTQMTTISKVPPFRCVICNFLGHRVQQHAGGFYPHTDEAQMRFQAFLNNQLSQPL